MQGVVECPYFEPILEVFEELVLFIIPFYLYWSQSVDLSKWPPVSDEII